MIPNYSIPPKDRPEWREIVSGKSKHTFDNYVLRMKTFKFSNKIKNGEVSEEEAVEELYELAKKYSRSVQRDFKTIFKHW